MTPNNLNAIRLAAAWMVLYGHSFVFLGLREPLFMTWLPLGPLGVFIFFAISGYLVSESWDRDPHLLRFFRRRLLRILPGLVVCVLLTVGVLGPLLTTLPLADYFSNPHTRGYLRTIGLYITYYLPGVFDGNRYPNAVNGSLWTLPVEFLMYIVVALVGVLHGNRWVMAALAVASALTCLLWAQVSQSAVVIYGFDLRQAFICGIYFWVGATIQKFGLVRHLSLTGGILALIAMLCLEPWTRQLAWASWVLLPVAVLSFGFAHSRVLSRLLRSGDYSYGVYIYAFPIQQTIARFWPDIAIGPYLAASTVGTLVCAVLSWHLVERRALSFKPRRPNADRPVAPRPGNSMSLPRFTDSSKLIQPSATPPIPLLYPIGHFYSPIIDPADLRAREARLWSRVDEMPGIDMNVLEQFKLLQALEPYTRDIDWPVEQPKDPTRYFYGNDQYPVLDAEFLHAVLRHFRPKAMIEVGSGWSSLITAEVNRTHLGRSMEFSCIEPYPRQFLIDGVDGITQLVRQRVEDVELSFFDRLGDGDILFIDSSHVSKAGSDVNYLFFEVLPRLRPGVIVHIHDIFLPDEYPKEWVIDQGRNWNEQYVVRAFLEFNTEWQLIWAAHFMGTRYTTSVQATFPRYPLLGGGGSIWLRRVTR